jgi:hypothetical protein
VSVCDVYSLVASELLRRGGCNEGVGVPRDA